MIDETNAFTVIPQARGVRGDDSKYAREKNLKILLQLHRTITVWQDHMRIA